MELYTKRSLFTIILSYKLTKPSLYPDFLGLKNHVTA